MCHKRGSANPQTPNPSFRNLCLIPYYKGPDSILDDARLPTQFPPLETFFPRPTVSRFTISALDMMSCD